LQVNYRKTAAVGRAIWRKHLNPIFIIRVYRRCNYFASSKHMLDVGIHWKHTLIFMSRSIALSRALLYALQIRQADIAPFRVFSKAARRYAIADAHRDPRVASVEMAKRLNENPLHGDGGSPGAAGVGVTSPEVTTLA
jgi:hypothetical protein